MKQPRPLPINLDQYLLGLFFQWVTKFSLLILESTLRRSGGGEMVRVGEAVRLTPPSTILRALVRENVVRIVNGLAERKYKLSFAQYDEGGDDVSGEKRTR